MRKPNAKTQREWFHIVVEYRLKEWYNTVVQFLKYITVRSSLHNRSLHIYQTSLDVFVNIPYYTKNYIYIARVLESFVLLLILCAGYRSNSGPDHRLMGDIKIPYSRMTKICWGNIGNLFVICMRQVTKGHLYHLLGVSDYYVMYRQRAKL